MKSTSTTQPHLLRLLDSLANGAASMTVDDAREVLYPVSFDPATGLLIISEDN